jgi:hypothetical protein
MKLLRKKGNTADRCALADFFVRQHKLLLLILYQKKEAMI